MKHYLTQAETREMLIHVAAKIVESESWLTEIDEKIGDGDHGIGMARGFSAAKRLLESDARFDSVNDLWKAYGMELLDAMGGASGVIFGTMFISGFSAVSKTDTLDLVVLCKMFERSLMIIKERGKAKIGDKTMIDAFEPAVLSLKRCVEEDSSLCDGLAQAEKAVLDGVEKCKLYQAKTGRASSYGQQSIGYPDPGCISVSIIFKAMNEFTTAISKGDEL